LRHAFYILRLAFYVVSQKQRKREDAGGSG